MLNDVEWAEDGVYTPQGEHTPHEFFSNALSNSLIFDIQLGYFNSAAINVLSSSFATFISNGGFMRMAINQIVSAKDKDAISSGLEGGLVAPFDLTCWESIKAGLDEYGEHFFKCLAYLIQEKRIEIQIIKPKATTGIAHTKRGQFVDSDGMIVGFSGSANFTLGGLFNNLEDINIFLSTSPDISIQKKIANQKAEFDRVMNGTQKEIEYLSSKDLEAAITSSYGNQDIEDLLNVEDKLRSYKQKAIRAGVLKDGEQGAYQITPRFPYREGPREYQRAAFENWRNNNQKGLFAMATGTGKTITSLNCLYEIYSRKGYYKAIILVPTVTLVNQWEEECRKFRFSNIVKVFSKNPFWQEEVDRICFNEKYQTDELLSYIIISTYASYSRPKVFDKLNSLDRRRVLLIADEAHNMGAESMAKKLKEIPYARRVGLSATPERQFDDAGNTKLRKFFGAEESYTFEYSMDEAIHGANPVLCKYFYYPHVIRLTDEEKDAYIELSEKISKYFNYNTETFTTKDEILKRLLLARKRIIHKAANKLPAFREIVHKRFEERGNLNYTLVYVPEGLKPDYFGAEDDFDKSDTIAEDADTDRLINEYTAAVLNVDGHVTVRKFVSGQKDREELLRNFATGKVQVLTSMKCLDEGVDVPRSELAIFCSSTGNPRQFIQRRGRVLRKHPDKEYAILHDLVVVPEVGAHHNSYKMERSLLKSELARVKNFADMSENPSFSEMELRSALDYYALNL